MVAKDVREAVRMDVQQPVAKVVVKDVKDHAKERVHLIVFWNAHLHVVVIVVYLV